MDLRRASLIVVVNVIASSAAECRAQGTRADYERADALAKTTQNKVFKTSVRPHWFANNTKFWYRNDLANERLEFVLVDAAKAERRAAFDHAKLAGALAKSIGREVAPEKLPIDRLVFENDGVIRFRAAEKGWQFNPETGSIESAEVPPASDEPARRADGRTAIERVPASSPRGESSPDGKWTAIIRDHNLHLREKATGAVRALSFEGSDVDRYEAGVYWSPDSKRLVALRTRKGDQRSVNLIESSPKSQLQPRLSSYEYLKPGDQVAVSKPHLFDVEHAAEVPVSDELFRNPWSIDDIRWSPDSARFTFLFNQRGHQVLRVVAVNALTGAAKAIVDETSKTFIDYSSKTYIRNVDSTDELLWMSERDGWNHLYLIDGKTGAVKNQVTKGEWVVRAIDKIDEKTRQVWFRAGGVYPGQDPYFIHDARVNFDGSGFTLLTDGDGSHSIEYSPDKSWYLDTYSRVDMPPVTELRRAADGSRVCDLERGDWSDLVAAGWRAPERFTAKDRDGVFDIHGVIFRPSNFDSAKSYPVIEQIYAGPHGAFVPKRFAAFHPPQALAELGFIVVQIDGKGTNWRSKAFHDACWRNLADAGFPDRIAWLKAAAKERPFMDLNRVGVYGGSAGGQNALGALLFHGDFYKAAAADCGCHDNRMDKIWWNEAWMGWPVGPHYEQSSNVANAHRLRGKLLLTVGELDRNVDPASTMQVVNALIKAGKDFELIVFPGAGHGAGSSDYGQRRMRDFFVRNLLGAQPPDWNAADTASESHR